MSRRGGGGGGRRSDSGRGQQPPSPAPSFSQGRGGGRGRGGGVGRGREYPASPASGIVHPASSSARGQPWSPAPSTSSVSSPAPAIFAAPAPESLSSVSESLSGDIKSLELEAKDLPAKVPPSSSKAIQFPPRPGYGKMGTKCLVRANHFLVEVADKDLYHYDVSVTPEVTSKTLNRDIMNQLVKSYCESHLGKRIPAYDGRKSLYTAGRLPFESKEFVVKIVEGEGQAGSSTARRKERQFKVAIKFASRPDLHYLQEFLQSRHAEAPQETIQALDVVLRSAPSEKYVVVGRSFFSPALGNKGPLADGIEYWKGYYQSLRPTQMGLSLNIDISARSFYEPILVTDFILKHFNRRDLTRPLSDQERLKLKKVLKGVKVEPIYLGYRRSYKVSGISREATNKISFLLDDQRTRVGVVQYFKEKYNIVLKYTSLPALLAGTEAKPVYLPMELCRISDGQRYTKKLNEKQVTALLRATCQRPNVRESDIKQMVNYNNFNRDNLVNEFGIQVAGGLAVVEARVLPPPMLKYHETGKESKVNPSVGQWNMINKKMVNGGRVDYWTCINFSARVDPSLPSIFCTDLVNMCISKGMVFNPKPLIPITNGNPSQIDGSLTNVKNQSQGRLQLLIIILPDMTGSYGQIKRICETDLGIVTQCCKPQQASKLSKQYLENLSLKINVKVGGRNTVLIDAVQKRIPLLTDRPTIIFGADVTHPQPGEDSSSSIAAVVASMDWPEVTKYRSVVASQAHREEIIMDLYKDDVENNSKGIIWELLRAFYRSTKQKPDRIIFYRDGVSEGQFSQVLLYEISAIRKACAALQEDYMPRITFVVVQKRHHTRLFPTDRNMTDRSGNILPGTVVDTQICHPTQFDFYLNSHSGIQGTSRPTHYHVLYDENGFTADILQMLTYSLCYTYARCTRSVSIVPPAYYAHLAAFRARYYVEGDASEVGSSSEGRRGREGNVEVRSLPSIKENVKEVMFYC